MSNYYVLKNDSVFNPPTGQAIATINFADSTQIDLGVVGNIVITGGSEGQVLSTDGTGNLSWVDQSGGGGNTTDAVNHAFALSYFNSI